MNQSRTILLVLCVVALLLVPMYGQKTDGSVQGIVTDPAGAVVPNAPVTITNIANGQTRATSTDSGGYYSVPQLPPGQYEVVVKAPSFKEARTRGVEVHVASSTTVDVHLTVGSASEQVEVNANAIQVETGTAALGEIIDSTQVSELPLNGRSFVQLTQLAPGVSAANNFDGKNKGLQGGVDFSVNGNATTNNLFLVDGANNNDVGSNRTILTYPAVESVAEFKMLRNSYGPEYGQASGAVINIVTKSGSNQFHGSVFYGGRNDALAAFNYFAKQTGKKDALRRNDYGFAVGGPVKKDKLFFFYSEEWNKELRGLTKTSCLPTAEERSGDFSNPSCGAGLPNIPVALQDPGNPHKFASDVALSPAGLLLIQKYPLPNASLPGGANWALSQGSKLDWRQDHGRADFNINKSNSLMFSFTQDHWENPAPTGGSYWGDDVFPTLNSSWTQPSKMIVGKWTSTIGGSMVNDAEFAYSNNRINVTAAGTDPGLLAQISAAVAPIYPESLKNTNVGLPTIWGGFGAYGGGQNYWMQAPWNNTLDIYSARDDLSKAIGNHNFKAGVYLSWNGKNEDNGNPGSERPAFGAQDWGVAAGPYAATGNPLANVLTPGMVFNLGESSTNVRAQMRWRDYEFYVGDNWKLRRNVTVEYGVRYSLLLSPFQAQGKSTGFNPALYDPNKPASDACNGLWTVPGTDPCGAANQQFGTSYSQAANGPNKYLVNQNYHMFAPRLGIAWDPFGHGNTAVRFGVGQFFQRERVSGPYYIIAANAPFAVAGSLNRSLDGPTPPSLSGSASPAGGRDPSNKIPNSWQWNASVEHTFARETSLQIGYVGNRAIHQTSNYDLNLPNPNGVAASCAVGGTTYTDVANWLCGAFQSGASLNALRPYSNFGQLAWWTHTGDASYHSLQVLFKTRYKRSQATAAYTYSHSISNVLLDNSDGGVGVSSYTWGGNPRLDRGNSPINRPHIFVANATYFLPELKDSNPFVKAAFGGWELSGITSAASGAAHTVYQDSLGENTGNLVAGATGSGLQELFAASVKGMIRPLVTGTSCTAGRKGSLLYDPAAFTLVGYELGTIPSNTEPRGYCPGPRLVNTDLSIDKNFKLTERFRMQFRLDFFDLFNHPNFRGDALQSNLPFLSVNCGPADGNSKYQPCSPTNNVVSAETSNTGFGLSNTMIGNAGREMQYSLKITF